MPSLEWEENLFLGLKALYRSAFVSPKERSIRSRQASLTDLRAMLLILGKILSGKNISLFESDDPLLYFGTSICLPSRIHFGSSSVINTECYILRTVASAIGLRFELSAPDSDIAALLLRCSQTLPEFTARLFALEVSLGGKLQLGKLFPKLPSAEQMASIEDEQSSIVASDQPESATVTEIQGQGRTNVCTVEEGETGAQELPFHTFEKIETLEEYNGLTRQNDAEDELADHQEALAQLKMDSVLRTSDRSQSVYTADVMLDGICFELGNQPCVGTPYPEWDYKRRKYRDKWCYVHEGSIERLDGDWAHITREKYSALILTLKKRFAAVVTDWLKIKRQSSGEEFDFDALVDLVVRLKTKEPPTESVYINKRRSLPNISTLLLLDSSYSTDSWVQNRRVIDVMKETVLCLAEVLDDAQQSLAIYGFASNTRQSCRLSAIKRFDQTWRSAQSSLGGLEPVGYTRIGPALRHAYSAIFPKQAEKKLVILITDGKPCDYDRYEGRYGVEDVRKAIAEGKEQGIMTHAFAIDKQAREYFPIMFAKADYDIVPNPEKLVGTLFQLFLKVMLKDR